MAVEPKKNVENGTSRTRQDRYTVDLCFVSILSIYIVCVVSAFYSGRRLPRSILDSSAGILGRRSAMPQVALPPGKRAPQSTYSSKSFNGADLAVSSHDTLVEGYAHYETSTDECTLQSSGDYSCAAEEEGVIESNDDDGNDETHAPQGQHLLLDFKNVAGDFLADEGRLAAAMINLIEHSGLTLLSYHCSRLDMKGVSCIGVLLESHVAFHTRPSTGMISLDLFTCGDGDLVPLVPMIEQLFSVSSPLSSSRPLVKWSHKKRGFSLPNDEFDAAGTDLREGLLGSSRYGKHLLAALDTPFQRIDVFDIVDWKTYSMERYERSLSHDGSYESEHPEFYHKERVVYLDSVMQSRQFGEAAYHESLVHPALLVHENPRRVAILGGGEGATLREVLRHSSVENVTMIEIDKQMIHISRKVLSQWNDCRNIKGIECSCFDSDLATVVNEDAIAWFVNRYNVTLNYTKTGMTFDIIVIDVLDPNSKEFSDNLYNNTEFIGRLSNALGTDGILVAQIGQSFEHNEYPEGYDLEDAFVAFRKGLEASGFESILIYTDSHARFESPWDYLIAFKDSESRARWWMEESVANVELLEKLRPTLDGSFPLKYFDGATFAALQRPSRLLEDTFCRQTPPPESCDPEYRGHGHDPFLTNVPVSAVEVRGSSQGEHSGRGLFALHDIAKDSYIGLEESNMWAHPMSVDVIWEHHGRLVHQYFDVLEGYLEGYGWAHSFYGTTSVGVETSPLLFANHGCNGTNNMGYVLSFNEFNASSTDSFDDEAEVFDPAAERWFVDVSINAAIVRDIRAGEEILENYLVMEDQENWLAAMESLRAMCQGQPVGRVTIFENIVALRQDLKEF